MKILKHIGRLFTLGLMLGMCYAQIELFVRGFTYLPMTFIGGIGGVLVGLLNQHPAFFNRRMWVQCLVGTLLILTVEYMGGYICNIRLHMGLWSYAGEQFNLNGQICLRMAINWFLLCPFGIWLDDWIRYKLFSERQPDATPLTNYIRLVTLK